MHTLVDERTEQLWNTFKAIDAYEVMRTSFRGASQKVVGDVLKKYLTEGQHALEISSGLGELVRLAPEFRKQIQQTDVASELVATNLARDPMSNIMEANVYSLPFHEKSYDAVIGYSSLDVLSDLPAAVREMRRVLKDRGLLIHFLDLGASIHPIFEKHQTPEMIVFPFAETVNGILSLTGLQVVKRADFERHKQQLLEEVIPAYEMYASDPEVQFSLLMGQHHLAQLLDYMGLDITALPIDKEIIRFNEDFQHRMKVALKNNGFEVIKCGFRQAEAVINRSDCLFPVPDAKNLLINKTGLVLQRSDPALSQQLKPEELKAVSELMVIVARKEA